MPLVRKRPQRPGQKLEPVDTDADLALPGCDNDTRRTDPIPQIEVVELCKALLTERPGIYKQLDPAGLVLEHPEYQLAHPPHRHEPPGNSNTIPGLNARLQRAIPLVKLTGGVRALESVGIARTGHGGLVLGQALCGQWMVGQTRFGRWLLDLGFVAHVVFSS